MVGLMSVEWGAASARRRDVVVGGLAGIVLAGSWTAVMSLIVVAGAVGRLQVAHPVGGGYGRRPPSALVPVGHRQRGGRRAGRASILILFGLAALAPACYSSFLFIRKLFARWPRVRRIDWAWIGCTRGPGPGRDDLAWPARGGRLRHGRCVRTGGRRDGRGFHGPAGPVGGRPARDHPPGAIAWVIGVAIRPILDFLAASGSLPLAAA